MLSLNTLLFIAFLIEQLYALNFHFPRPPSGLVYPQSLQLLKLLSTVSALAAWTPATHSSSPTSDLLSAVTTSFFSSSLCLFAWTGMTTRPRRLSVIYGRVTPMYVISSGPFAYVRHPTYVAYALGWIGAVLRVLNFLDIAAGTKAGWSLAPLRSIVLLTSVLSLLWLYRRGTILEEEQFLKGYMTVVGQKVGEDVRVEYLAYMRRVPYRWIPRIA